MPTVIALYPGTFAFRQGQVAAHKPMLDAFGIELVLADDVIDARDRELFADVIELPPPEQVGEALRRLERWNERHPVQALLAQSESGLCAGSLFAARAGLPALPPRAALLTTSKHLCRAELERARVPQPRFTLARDADGVRRAAREFGYPVVLKAIASALGRLVTLVKSADDVEHAVSFMRERLPASGDVRRLDDFARTATFDLGCSPFEDFLVEEFQRGEPIETDGFVARDAIRTFGVTEQVLCAPPYFFMQGYLLPAERSPADLARAEAVSDAALRALGVRDTGFSIELRLHAGEAHVIEVNGRLGWDEGFGDLFASVTGVQPAFQTLQVALGIDPPFERRATHAAVAYRSCYEDALVKRLPTASELSACEREHDVRAGLATWEEARFFAPPHPEATPHVLWALAQDVRSSRAAYERARTAVHALPMELAPVPHAI